MVAAKRIYRRFFRFVIFSLFQKSFKPQMEDVFACTSQEQLRCSMIAMGFSALNYRQMIVRMHQSSQNSEMKTDVRNSVKAGASGMIQTLIFV